MSSKDAPRLSSTAVADAEGGAVVDVARERRNELPSTLSTDVPVNICPRTKRSQGSARITTRSLAIFTQKETRLKVDDAEAPHVCVARVRVPRFDLRRDVPRGADALPVFDLHSRRDLDRKAKVDVLDSRLTPASG